VFKNNIEHVRATLFAAEMPVLSLKMLLISKYIHDVFTIRDPASVPLNTRDADFLTTFCRGNMETFFNLTNHFNEIYLTTLITEIYCSWREVSHTRY